MKKPAAAAALKKKPRTAKTAKVSPRKADAIARRLDAARAKRAAAEAKAQAKEAAAATAAANRLAIAEAKAAKPAKAPTPAKPLSQAITFNGTTFDFHPYCELLPVMSCEELDALCEDVRANGQREPGVLFDGKILDGRNRYLCCEKLGIPFEARCFNPDVEGTPLSYIISKATHRNMNDTQKACSAVGIQDELAKQGAARRNAALKVGGSVPEAVPEREGDTRDQAGALFGVSGRYVTEARFLRDNARDLYDRCFNGLEVLTRAKREYQRRVKKDDLSTKAAAVPTDAKIGDRSRILTGDAISVLPTIDEKCRLAFLDPKYNLGRKYDGEGIVDDNMTPAEYGRWLASLVELSAAKLTDDGSICVMIHSRWLPLVCTTLESLGLHWRDTFAWYYKFGNSRSAHTGFTPAYVPIAHYTRHPTRHVFNGESILVESWRQQNGDKRASDGGKVMDNVFDVPRLVDNHPEKVPGFDNQVPLAVMTPIVLALTDPGDLVLDPGVGSGSTGVAAVTNNRRFLGIDVVPDNAAMAGVRIAAAYADHLQRPAFEKKARKAS